MLSCPRSPARRVFTRTATNERGTQTGARGGTHRLSGGIGQVETGLHPLDGARYLRRVGIDGLVVSLVAYHSCAQIEADVRGQRARLIPGNEGIDGYS